VPGGRSSRRRVEPLAARRCSRARCNGRREAERPQQRGPGRSPGDSRSGGPEIWSARPVPDLPVLTRELLAAGFSPSELARLARSGELVRLRRGAYRPASDIEPDAEMRHRQLLAATVPLLAPDAVLSHRSAAVVLGLPLVSELGRVEVTRSSVGSGKRRGSVHLRAAPLPAEEVTVADGFRVTTLARTVVDLARTLPLGPAVAAGDAALRAGATVDELEAVLVSSAGRPGLAAARRACRMFDGRSESAGESLSRVTLHGLGLARRQVSSTRCATPPRPSSAAATSCGRSTRRWVSSTSGSSTGGCSAPVSVPRTCCGRRSCARTRSETSGGRWCAGPGPTLADLDREGLIADRLHRAFRRAAR